VPSAEAKRMTGQGAAETIDRAAMPLPDAVACPHPDGIDVLVDVASEAAQLAALAGHVRPVVPRSPLATSPIQRRSHGSASRA
jgi:hypothetical protein